jgi:hypothetical protein
VSKFDRLFRVANDDSGSGVSRLKDQSAPVSMVPHEAQAKPTTAKAGNKKTAKLAPVPAGQTSEEKEREKISGKRQHPDYVGLTTYIRKDVHRRVKIALLVEGQNRELSELVDELLAAWLAGKNS